MTCKYTDSTTEMTIEGLSPCKEKCPIHDGETCYRWRKCWKGRKVE